MSTTEIERKFIATPPSGFLDSLSSVDIEQGYLCINSVDKEEARVRRTKNSLTMFKEYTMCIKSGSGLVRGEFETFITKNQYNDVFPATKGRVIQKKRYFYYTSAGKEVSIDVFSGKLEGLILAEVEFATVEEAEQFTPLDWFGKDITNDSTYKNSSLAVKGLPK